MKFHHLQAWALVALGAWLLLSPFVVPGFAPGSAAAKDCYIVGFVALVIGCFGGIHARRLDETIDMALGIGPEGAPRGRR